MGRAEARPVREAWAIPLIVGVVAIVAFCPTIANDWVDWDDFANFIHNHDFRGFGLHQLKWAWTTRQTGVYQPLSWILICLQYVAFEMSAPGYHFVSVLMHACNSVLVYFVAQQLIEAVDPVPQYPHLLRRCVAVAALVFAAHPIRAEAVAWVSCQPYLPSAFFFMLSIGAYVKAHGSGEPNRRLALASLAFFVFAMLCKAVSVALPVVLLILDVFVLNRLPDDVRRWTRKDYRVLLEKLPYLGVSLVFSVIAMIAKDEAQSIVSLTEFGVPERFAQSAYGMFFYLTKTLWPFGLATYYPTPEHISLVEPRFLLSITGFIGVTVFLVLHRKQHRAAAAVVLSYVAILAPNVGFVRASRTLASDRYAYVSFLPWVPFIAVGMYQFVLSESSSPREVRRNTAYVPVFGGVLSAVLVFLSAEQSATWRNSIALWSKAAAHYPESAEVQQNLGDAYRREDRFAEAFASYNSALRASPNSRMLNFKIGVLHLEQGHIDEAIALLSNAIVLDPGSPAPHAKLSYALFQKGMRAEAEREAKRAVEMAPLDADSHFQLGLVYSLSGKREEARQSYLEAARLKPQDAKVYYNLGVLYSAMGDPDAARAYYENALRIDPTFAIAAAALAKLDQASETPIEQPAASSPAGR